MTTGRSIAIKAGHETSINAIETFPGYRSNTHRCNNEIKTKRRPMKSPESGIFLGRRLFGF